MSVAIRRLLANSQSTPDGVATHRLRTADVVNFGGFPLLLQAKRAGSPLLMGTRAEGGSACQIFDSAFGAVERQKRELL